MIWKIDLKLRSLIWWDRHSIVTGVSFEVYAVLVYFHDKSIHNMRIIALPVFITFHSSTLIVSWCKTKDFLSRFHLVFLQIQAASWMSITYLQFLNEFESWDNFLIEVQQNRTRFLKKLKNEVRNGKDVFFAQYFSRKFHL